MTERLRGRITDAEYSPMTAKWTYRASFPILPSSHLEATFVAAERLEPGARVAIDHANIPVNSRVIDEVTGWTWPCEHVEVEEDLLTMKTPVLVISAEMQERLHARAKAAGVEAEIVTDDMERPVLIVRTGRGTIRRGISGLDSWHTVLESVGLGGTL